VRALAPVLPKEALNETVGEEVHLPCRKCSGKTAHNVIASVDQSGYDEDSGVHWEQHYQIVRCLGCKTVSFRDASSNSDDFVQTGRDEWETRIFEKLYPSRVESRKDLGRDVIHLPAEVRTIYAETVQALNGDSPVLAGIGLRALVESVCKERNASGKDLFAKINDLAAQQVLTPAGAQILHKIRTLGNKAAHEVKPHTERQLALALNVVEHLLKDVYILPKLVQAEFD
jgi:hypothetical protein